MTVVVRICIWITHSESLVLEDYLTQSLSLLKNKEPQAKKKVVEILFIYFYFSYRNDITLHWKWKELFCPNWNLH